MEEDNQQHQNENDISKEIKTIKVCCSTIKDKSTNDVTLTPNRITKNIFDIVSQLSTITSTFFNKIPQDQDEEEIKYTWHLMNKVVYPIELDDQINQMLYKGDNPHFIQENKILTKQSIDENLTNEKINSFQKFFEGLLNDQEDKLNDLKNSFKGTVMMEEDK